METSNKTVLITGVYSTLGRHIAKLFLDNDWHVIGTTRNLEKSNNLINKEQPNVTILQLDLFTKNDMENIMTTVKSKFDKIDVLINNAGHVLTGPLEGMSEKQIRNQMEVNFLAPVLLIKKMLPLFKAQKKGAIINISSLCGLVTFPMFSMYHASKWALEGFSESLMYELEPFNIKVKLIEPGGIKDNDYSSMIEFGELSVDEYDKLLHKVHNTNWFPSFTHPKDIAKIVYDAATDNTSQLRYPVGEDCTLFLKERTEGFMNEKAFDNIKNRINGK